MTSRPLEVGKLAEPNMPPTKLTVEFVSRSFPFPWVSGADAQLSNGPVAVFPLAVRHATFVPLVGVGTVTVPVSVEPPGFAAIAIVTLPTNDGTGAPSASCT